VERNIWKISDVFLLIILDLNCRISLIDIGSM